MTMKTLNGQDEEHAKFIRPSEFRFCELDHLVEQSIRSKDLWIDCFFVYALVWSFGSILKEEARAEFNDYVLETLREKEQEKVANKPSDENMLAKLLLEKEAAAHFEELYEV